MTTTRTPEQTVERYAEFWNAGTPQDQQLAAQDVLTDDVEYSGLPLASTGPEPMINFRNEFIGHVGQASYRVRATPDHHRDRMRIPWEIVLADGSSFAAGTDMVTITPDGRISAITAFLDRAPDGFEQHLQDAAHQQAETS